MSSVEFGGLRAWHYIAPRLTAHATRNRWARKGGAAAPHDSSSSSEGSSYSSATLRSLAAADEALLNYDLLEALVGRVVERVQGAILVFLPGAPEIGRLVRLLGRRRCQCADLGAC